MARQTMSRTAVMRWNSQAHMPPRWVETVSAFTYITPLPVTMKVNAT